MASFLTRCSSLARKGEKGYPRWTANAAVHTPRDYCGLKKFLPAYGRKIKCIGKHDIEIKKRQRRHQKIRLVYRPEMHRLYPDNCHWRLNPRPTHAV